MTDENRRLEVRVDRLEKFQREVQDHILVSNIRHDEMSKQLRSIDNHMREAQKSLESLPPMKKHIEDDKLEKRWMRQLIVGAAVVGILGFFGTIIAERVLA